jgi:ATP-binding protein involved in chromosome partitioning
MPAMANDLEARVWEALKTVRYPGMSRDVVSFGFVEAVTADDEGNVAVRLHMTTHNPEAAEQVRREVEGVVGELPGVVSGDVELRLERPPAPQSGAQRAVSQGPDLVPEVKHIVAVASGKGGVGKSTVAANLAVALAKLGHTVGLLDADIYGPSVPILFGIADRPRLLGQRIQPFERYGVKLMSLGFILDTDTPVIWRGPMVMRGIEQMLGDVDWGPLDYLVVDLPPGTGDAQLTITQRVPLAGAVIVTTPQDVALIDARKGLAMFRKVNVPVLGIVENMSGFVCPHCGEETDVFKRGGGERTADLLGTRFLGRVPLDPAIVRGSDAGVPAVVAPGGEKHAAVFAAIAQAVIDEVAKSAEQVPVSIV